MEAVVDAAAAGMGIANVPDWLVREHLRDGRLVTLLDAHTSTQLDTFAVWPGAEHLPMRLRLAIDMLAARLPATLL
jgi:DNA-binding transcriptional LysR family regulator